MASSATQLSPYLTPSGSVGAGAGGDCLAVVEQFAALKNPASAGEALPLVDGTGRVGGWCR